jgi:membrane-bound lytic murein transglycosylase D
LDLKYLAIVESNMNPQAGSWAGASGLWQFMPGTGANYGLAKNSKVNLFYDPYMSTDAACRYLKYLYNLFGDWNLVLSAYNSGEGRVMGAIRKAGTKNYWAVRNYLPAETKAYAPSFHAVRFIGKMYGLYYENLPKLKYDYSVVREFTTKSATTFKELSKVNGLNLEQLYFLNPHIVTEQIPKGTFVYYMK